MTSTAVQAGLVWLSAGLVAFAMSATLTTWLMPVLRRHGAVTAPGPDGCGRAVPRGGGLAIVAVALPAGLVAGWLTHDLRSGLVAWLIAAGAIAVVSLRDDFRPLPALARLAVHVAAAVVITAIADPITAIVVPGVCVTMLGNLAWPVTLVWLVGLTNAFNFMDGIDGIAGVTAAVAGATLAIAAGFVGADPVASAALAMSAGAIGFLTLNWPPARVFMGDVGSTFCGFSLAALPMVLPPTGRGPVLEAVLLAMWPFIVDSGFTLTRRIIRRENVLEQHQGHLYQRLVMTGWSHRAVAGLFGTLAAIGGAIAVVPLFDPALPAAFGTAAAAYVVVVPVLLVTLVQVAEAGAACRVST